MLRIQQKIEGKILLFESVGRRFESCRAYQANDGLWLVAMAHISFVVLADL